MMNLYNGFCYSDMTALINHIISEPVQVSGTDIIYSSLISTSGNSATFSTSIGNYTRTFSECSSVGPLTTNTMMSVSDAVQLSGAVMMVWAAAWAVKVLRRCL